jgi:hypothetical protein
MPDVSLFTATEPVSKDEKVVIRFSVEVGGLQVYNESYDVDSLAANLKKDREKALQLWERRLLCVIEARRRPGFSAAVTRCIADGVCGDYGSKDTMAVDELGPPA